MSESRPISKAHYLVHGDVVMDPKDSGPVRRVADALVEMQERIRLSQVEADGLRSALATLQSALATQDERERNAAERLGMPWNRYWPDGVADQVGVLRAEVARLRAALERNRQGYRNILEFRRLTDGRFGWLTREEIEQCIAGIDEALAQSGGGK